MLLHAYMARRADNDVIKRRREFHLLGVHHHHPTPFPAALRWSSRQQHQLKPRTIVTMLMRAWRALGAFARAARCR